MAQLTENIGRPSKQDLIDKIISEKKYYETATRKLREEAEEIFRLYASDHDDENYPWHNKKFIPKTHQATEVLASILVANEPTVNVFPIGEEDELKSDLLRELLQFQWKKVLHMKPKVRKIVKSGILFGTAWAKLGWDSTEDEPFCEPVDFADVYTDPFSPHVQKVHSLLHRMVLKISDIKSNPAYRNTSKVTPERVTSVESDSSEMHDKTDMGVTAATDSRVTMLDKAEVWEYWTQERVVTIANPKGKAVILRDMKNPYGFIPFVAYTYVDSPLPNRLYGWSAIQPNINLQRGMNSLFNQILDAVEIITNPMYKRRRGANVPAWQLISRPGGFIDVNEQGDIEVMSNAALASVLPMAVNVLNRMNSEFEEGTSVVSLRKGIGGADTATEAQFQSQSLSIQSESVKDSLEVFITELGSMLMELNLQNLDSVRTIRIFSPQIIERMIRERSEGIADIEFVKGNSFLQEVFKRISNNPLGISERQNISKRGALVKFSKKAIDGKYDVEVLSDSMVSTDRTIMRKQLLDYVQVMGRLGVKLDTREISDDWGKLSGIPNARKYIIGEPENPVTIPDRNNQVPPTEPGEQNSTQAISDAIRNQLSARG
jgi:hypothetical protein